MMNRLVLVVGMLVVVLATGVLAPDRAAAGIPGGQIPGAADGLSPIETVQLCFYPDGWAGPGLYRCGYRFRRGEGFVERREREEREERRERRDFFEDRRERRDRFEDRRDRRDRFEDRR
jgi:hypothetical protein